MTSRAKARLRESASMGMLYGTVVPADTIAVLLGVTFCLISPIIAPLALLYFMTSYLVSKYNLIMVAKERFQSGGLVSLVLMLKLSLLVCLLTVSAELVLKWSHMLK